MRFFTSEWWASGSAESTEVFSRYEAHLASIRDSLPQSLVQFEEEHTLHDSEVKHIECNFQNRSLSLKLLGWDLKLENKVRYTLQFSDVFLFDQMLPQQEYVESELGDVGYWEISLVGKDVEVCILFVSGAEFRVLFRGFGFSHERLA